MELTNQEKNKVSSNITALLACEKSTQYEFCQWAEQYGASASTLRDVVLLGYRDMARWKIKGIRNLLREFDPDYQGSVETYYEEVGMSERLYQFFLEEGGMSRNTVWARFRNAWFKPWELIGIEDLVGKFLQEKEMEVRNS